MSRRGDVGAGDVVSVRERHVAWLRDELRRIDAERAEVVTWLELLDADVEPVPAPAPKPALKPQARTREQGILNHKAILDSLDRYGSATADELGKRLGIASTTVYTHLKAMYDEGRVTRRNGRAPEGGGKAPFIYTFVTLVEEREHTLDLRTRMVES